MPVDNDQILEKLSEFHSEFTEFRGEVKARLTQVEKTADKAELWNNIKVVAVLPITVSLHMLGTKLGLIKR